MVILTCEICKISVTGYKYVYNWWQIMRFFTNPRKPMILAVARPYPEKNITTLVKAFGECRPLRELANLVRLILVVLIFYFCYMT